MGARGLIVGRCQTPLCWSRHRAGLEVQVAPHLRRLQSRHRGRRRTAYVTDYECVGANVGDAGATQQPKLSAVPRLTFKCLYQFGQKRRFPTTTEPAKKS
jgi:hypothetical protein